MPKPPAAGPAPRMGQPSTAALPGMQRSTAAVWATMPLLVHRPSGTDPIFHRSKGSRSPCEVRTRVVRIRPQHRWSAARSACR